MTTKVNNKNGRTIISSPTMEILQQIGTVENPLIVRGDHSELDEIISAEGKVCNPKYNLS